MDIMEQLLCPQISMDVDDTPLDLGHSSCSNDDGKIVPELNEDLTEDEKIKLLLQNDDFDVSQIPQTLTDHEESLKKTLFNVGPAVQFMKLHCTSCNMHLGSAPINQFNRFIHPLLHVLLCKGCYDFYTSGDFEKDEDGSELYCRWCGQGGKVMCCSDCAFVFCQKCVRGNLGKKTLDSIRDSDDWKCFVCNPKQLINLKLICNSLYHYIKDKIKIVKQGGSVEELKRDCTLCCNKPVSKGPIKRKRNNSETDVTFDINLEQTKRLKQKQVRSAVSAPWRAIAPALLPIKNKSKPNIPVKTTQNVVRNPAVNNAATLVMQNNKPIPIKKPITINTMTGNAVRIALPKQSIPVTRTVRLVRPRTSHVYNFHPTSKVDKQQPWFEKATKLVSNITDKLSCQVSILSCEQKNAGTVEKLAVVHNKLQELLSTSVNSLIQVRKNLRNEFMDDLKKTKPNTTLKTNQNEIILFDDQLNLHLSKNALRVRPPASLMKIYRNNKTAKEVKQVEKVIVEEDDDDDDVKLIEEEIETVEILDDDDVEPIKPPETVQNPIQENQIIDAENNVELIEQVEILVDKEVDKPESSDKVVEYENNSEAHVESDSDAQSAKATTSNDTEKVVKNKELPIVVENCESTEMEITDEKNGNGLIESVDEPETVELEMLNGSNVDEEDVSNPSSISKIAKTTDLSEKEIKRAMSVKVILLENNVENGEDSCENGIVESLSQATEKEVCNESSPQNCQEIDSIPVDNQVVNGSTETSDDVSINKCSKENRIDENASGETENSLTEAMSCEEDKNCIKIEELMTEDNGNGLCTNVHSEISRDAHCTTDSVIATT